MDWDAAQVAAPVAAIDKVAAKKTGGRLDQ
jgi:hypothetical protein